MVSSKVMHAVSRLYEMLAQYSNKKALVCITEESPRMPHIIKVTIAGIVDWNRAFEKNMESNYPSVYISNVLSPGLV